MEAILGFETPQFYRWKDPRVPPGAPELCIHFIQEPQVNVKVTADTGVQTYDNVLVAYVSAKPQDKSNVAHEIRRTLPDGTVKATSNALRFGEPLKHYDAGTAAEALGTPLRDLLGVTPAVIMSLKARGISTVEVLADLPDSAGGDMMGFWEFRDKARKHLLHRKENAPAVRMDAMEAAYERKIAALEKKIEDLVAVLPAGAAESATVEVKRKPGRPPKAEAPTQEAA